jgi:putative tricarboxylic transport membrane protein
MPQEDWTVTGFAKHLEGLLFMALGLLLFFVVIPQNVETVDYGRLKPATVPYVMAVVLFAAGLWLVVFPKGHEREDSAQMARVAMYLGVIALAVYAISLFGFLYVGPVLALIIMLLIGERRPLWLLGGVAGVPAMIWFAVEILLSRPLPG